MAANSQRPEEVNEVGPLVPLPKDPQPSVDRIDELAQRIHAGDILLPKFEAHHAARLWRLGVLAFLPAWVIVLIGHVVR
jgi:hypothetical protein